MKHLVIQRGPTGRRLRTVECDTLGRANDLAQDWRNLGMQRVVVLARITDPCNPRFAASLFEAIS